MKTGNIIALLLTIFLIALALACDLLLAKEYKSIDLKDPYKNFEIIPVSTFRNLSLSGGNGYAILIREGKETSVRLMKNRKSFFYIHQQGDSVSIGFRVANQTYQRPEDCVIGLIITLPVLSRIKVSGTNTLLTGLTSDSLIIQSDSAAFLRCQNLNMRRLSVDAGNRSEIKFEKANRAGLLRLNLSEQASATLQEINYDQLEPRMSDSATIRFYQTGLEKLLKPRQLHFR